MFKTRFIMAFCAAISLSLSSIYAHCISDHESKRKYHSSLPREESPKRPLNIDKYVTQGEDECFFSKKSGHYHCINSSLRVASPSNSWGTNIETFARNRISQAKKMLQFTWNTTKNAFKSPNKFIRRNPNASLAGASIAIAVALSTCTDYFWASYEELLKLVSEDETSARDKYQDKYASGKIETIPMEEIEVEAPGSSNDLASHLNNQTPSQPSSDKNSHIDLAYAQTSAQLEQEARLQDEFFETCKQYYYYPIPGDGNCGFTAIAEGLNALERFSDQSFDQYQIRQRLQRSRENHSITQMYQNPELPEEDICEVLEEGLNGYWFGDSENDIQRISNEFRVSIEVFDLYQHKITVYTPQTAQEEAGLSQDVIRLLYGGSGVSGHYDLLLE